MHAHIVPYKKIVSARLGIFILARQNCVIPHLGMRLKQQKVEREWRRPRAPSRPEHTQEMTLICARAQYASSESSQKTPAERRRSERTRHIQRRGFCPLVCSTALRGIWTKLRESFCSCMYVHIKELAPHQILRDLARDLCGWPRHWRKCMRESALCHRRATITLCDAELILKGLPAQTKQTAR